MTSTTPQSNSTVTLTQDERDRFDLREWWDYVLTDAPDADYKTILVNLERFVCEEVERLVATRAADANPDGPFDHGVDRAARLAAAFSGEEYEENAAAAAGEGEWSWFRWLALAALDPALPAAAPDADQG